MAMLKNAIRATSPVSVWKKPIKADLKNIFKSLTKATVHVVTGKPLETINDAAEAAAAAGLSTKPEELAFVLVNRAIARSIFDLVKEGTPLELKIVGEKADLLIEQMNFSVADQPVVIDNDFFRSPESHPIVHLVSLLLEQWLTLQQLPKSSAEAVVRRFPSYFVYSLHVVWREQSGSFAKLRETLNTPFSDALERVEAWEENAALLEKQVHEGVFGESFALLDLYVPLNAYATDNRKSVQESTLVVDNLSDTRRFPGENIEGPIDSELFEGMVKRENRHVFPLAQELTSWVEGNSEVDLHVRMISGGPGAGKSTVMRVLAAEWAGKGHRVILIPLHLLPEPSGNILVDVESYVTELGIFSHNPLDPKLKEKVVIIFDGLDELASRGRVAAEVARAFIRAVDTAIRLRNQSEVYIRALVSGRDIVVQENEADFNLPRQIIHLLPYWTPAQDQTNRDSITWNDQQKLLAKDFRDQWWKQYGLLHGEAWEGLPAELRREDLNEVTAQPLLNYLVALTKLRGQLDLQREITINAIYEGLVKAVYTRSYEKRGTHAAIRDMQFDEYVRVLEEIALTAWHGGDSRSTTVRKIEKQCQNAGLTRLLSTFQEGAKTGVTRLLVAFFFRRQGQDTAGDDTFEFTHKSFNEYLTACRLVRGMTRIVKEIRNKDDDADSGWDEKQAVHEWVRMTGLTAISPYLYQMWKNEISRRPISEVIRWQEVFVRIFSYLLQSGLPIEAFGPSKFREMLVQARNSEEALLVALNSCAVVTKKISMIRHPAPNTFGIWLRRIQGQRTGEENTLAMHCLGFLNLRGVRLHGSDLFGANLSYSDLRESCLILSNLQSANLEGTDCENADFQHANLNLAVLRDGNFHLATFTGSHLQSAKFNNSNLRMAKLIEADLKRAVLENAILDGADLNGASMQGAILRGASLQKAQLQRARLQGADMQNTLLHGANLSETNLEAANLFGVDLSKVDLNGAKLNGANLGQTIFADRIRRYSGSPRASRVRIPGSL